MSYFYNTHNAFIQGVVVIWDLHKCGFNCDLHWVPVLEKSCEVLKNQGNGEGEWLPSTPTFQFHKWNKNSFKELSVSSLDTTL